MALTLDGTIPSLGGGAGMGIGGGIAAAGLGGLLVGSLLGNNGNGLFGGNNNNGGAVAAAAATDVLLNPAFQSLQNQISAVANNQSNAVLANAISNVDANVSNLATAQATGNFTTLSSINGLGRDLVTNIHQQDLTTLNSFNQLTTTTLQGFNGSAMQLQNATNQIIAQGSANAAAMAACCCEIKGLIQSDGNATRALISDLNVQNLRDQLSAANNKVSNNEQNQYLLSTILTHIKPVVV